MSDTKHYKVPTSSVEIEQQNQSELSKRTENDLCICRTDTDNWEENDVKLAITFNAFLLRKFKLQKKTKKNVKIICGFKDCILKDGALMIEATANPIKSFL